MLAKSNASVVLCDIKVDELQTFHDGDKHRVYQVDVTSPFAVAKCVDSIMEYFGQINHLFNCTGIKPVKKELAGISDDDWSHIVDTNLKGTYLMTKAVIKHLGSGASIVNVSSSVVSHALAKQAIYTASKFGVVGFSKSMAQELGTKGIRVNVVAPGQINTPAYRAARMTIGGMERSERSNAMGRLGTAEELAGVVLFLVSHAAEYVNGAVIDVDGGAR